MAVEARLGHRCAMDEGHASLADSQTNKCFDSADGWTGTKYNSILLTYRHRNPTNERVSTLSHLPLRITLTYNLYQSLHRCFQDIRTNTTGASGIRSSRLLDPLLVLIPLGGVPTSRVICLLQISRICQVLQQLPLHAEILVGCSFG